MHGKILLALMLFVGTAHAQPVIVEPRMTGTGAFEEERLLAARISLDHVIAGVGFRAPEASEKPSVHAMLPWQGEPVCVRWKSADALYSAQAVYDLPQTNQTGFFRLAYPSAHADWLRDLQRDRLGITIAQGECLSGQGVFAPAIWNGEPAGPFEHLAILLNARRANEVYVIFEDATGAARDLTCRELSDSQGVGIDHVCEIPMDDLPAGPLPIEINQLRRGQPDTPLNIVVMIPDDR